jgi:ribosome-associated toxin RatA of RatAB toxin-antitoxin module
MGVLVKEVHINASKDKVWEAIADFGGIARWSPHIHESSLTSDSGEELAAGASRECVAPGLGGAFTENLIAYQPGEQFTVEISSIGPIKSSRSTWQAHEHDGVTHVVANAEFEMRFGLLGALMAPMVSKKLGKTLGETLLGLKHFIETGEEVGTELPAAAKAAV